MDKNIRDKLPIPDGWEQSGDFSSKDVSTLEYARIGSPFRVLIIDSSQSDDQRLSTQDGRDVIMVMLGFEDILGEVFTMHAVPIAESSAVLENHDELLVTFKHFVSVADAMDALLDLIKMEEFEKEEE